MFNFKLRASQFLGNAAPCDSSSREVDVNLLGRGTPERGLGTVASRERDLQIRPRLGWVRDSDLASIDAVEDGTVTIRRNGDGSREKGGCEREAATGSVPEHCSEDVVSLIVNGGDDLVIANILQLQLRRLRRKLGLVDSGKSRVGQGGEVGSSAVVEIGGEEVHGSVALGRNADGCPITSLGASLNIKRSRRADGVGAENVANIVMPKSAGLRSIGQLSGLYAVDDNRAIQALLIENGVDRGVGGGVVDGGDHDMLNVVIQEEPRFLPGECLGGWVGELHRSGTDLAVRYATDEGMETGVLNGAAGEGCGAVVSGGARDHCTEIR